MLSSTQESRHPARSPPDGSTDRPALPCSTEVGNSIGNKAGIDFHGLIPNREDGYRYILRVWFSAPRVPSAQAAGAMGVSLTKDARPAAGGGRCPAEEPSEPT